MQENEKLQAALQQMTRERSPLEVAQATYDENASDREKFRKLIDNLQVTRISRVVLVLRALKLLYP